MSKPTPEERIKAALEKRAQMQAAEANAYAEQQASDIEALVDLESEHGFDRVLRIDLVGWKPGSGASTLVAARIPLGSEKVIKRFEDTVAKSKERTTANLTAMQTVGLSCIVYPDREKQKELYDATIELAPAIVSKVGELVVKAVHGKAEEEKKD